MLPYLYLWLLSENEWKKWLLVRVLLEMLASLLLVLGWFTAGVGAYFLVVSFAAGGMLIACSILLLGVLCIFTSKQIDKHILST